MFVSFQHSTLFELFLFCCCSNKWLFCQSHFIRTLSNKLSSEYKFRIKAKIFHNFYAKQIVFESNLALFFKKLFHSITSDSHIQRFNTKMCEHYCDDLETFNPEIEYQKFLKRKPIVQTAKLYEQLHTREKIKCPCKYWAQKSWDLLGLSYNDFSYFQTISKAMAWKRTRTQCIALAIPSMATTHPTLTPYRRATFRSHRNSPMNLLAAACIVISLWIL